MARLLHLLQRHLLLLLIAAYVAAAVWPRAGLALRAWSLGRIALAGTSVQLSAPLLLLSLLLFNAAVTLPLRHLWEQLRRPRALLGGLVGSLGVSLAFTAAAALPLAAWTDVEERQALVAGLAVVGAMPVAGASVAWAHACGGSLALSLALVLSTTLLSPISTPLGLRVAAHLLHGDLAAELRALAGAATQALLLAAVTVPSVLGLLAHHGLGSQRIERARDALKLGNVACLLLLNYTNGAAVLPAVWRQPDIDYLLLIAVTVALRCLVALGGGRLLGRLVRAPGAPTTSLMFALGMSNNGSGLLLAAAGLADHSGALVVIVFANLAQQVAAALAASILARRAPAPTGAQQLPPAGR